MPSIARPLPTILLKPGRHLIDGVSVDIPDDPRRPFIEFPMTPGRHEVDNKVCIVANPGANVPIGR